MNNNINDIDAIADNLLLCETLTYDIYNKYFNTGLCVCVNCDAVIDIDHVYAQQSLSDYTHDIYNTIMLHVQQHYLNLSNPPNISSNINTSSNNHSRSNSIASSRSQTQTFDSIDSIMSNMAEQILNSQHQTTSTSRRRRRSRSRHVNYSHTYISDTPESLSSIISCSISDILNHCKHSSNLPDNSSDNDTDDTNDTIDNSVDDSVDNSVDDSMDDLIDDSIYHESSKYINYYPHRVDNENHIEDDEDNNNNDNEEDEVAAEDIDELSEEYDESYESGVLDESDEQEFCEYTYRCPVCENGYNDQYTLGRHFIRRHNDYNSYTSLDQKRGDGFPGFEVLIKIGMVTIPKEEETEKGSDYELCVVCCDEYTHTMHDTIKTYEDSDKNIKVYDDLLKHGDKNKKYNRFNDDTKLLYLNYKDNMPRYPIKMKCCRKIYCSECLRRHVNAKNGEPECPFCRRSFIQDDKRYIIFDERPESKIKQDPTPYQTKKRISYIDYTYDSDSDNEYC